MARTNFPKVTWLARVTSTVVGLAIMLALVFGVASMALGANGNPWILGQGNVATAITVLGGAAGVDEPQLGCTSHCDLRHRAVKSRSPGKSDAEQKNPPGFCRSR